MLAARLGHRAALELLLRHGADPALIDKSGHSALAHAAHDEAMRDVLTDAHMARVERAHAERLKVRVRARLRVRLRVRAMSG